MVSSNDCKSLIDVILAMSGQVEVPFGLHHFQKDIMGKGTKTDVPCTKCK